MPTPAEAVALSALCVLKTAESLVAISTAEAAVQTAIVACEDAQDCAEAIEGGEGEGTEEEQAIALASFRQTADELKGYKKMLNRLQRTRAQVEVGVSE